MPDVAPERPATLLDAFRIYGDPRKYIKADGSISRDWEDAILASVKLPRPLALSWDRSVRVTKVRCHKLLVGNFERAYGLIADADLWDELRDFGGGYNWRLQRGGVRPSLHAFGAAVDHDVSRNPLGGEARMHPGIVQIFESVGFFWGGRWKRPDGMHFEWSLGRF